MELVVVALNNDQQVYSSVSQHCILFLDFLQITAFYLKNAVTKIKIVSCYKICATKINKT